MNSRVMVNCKDIGIPSDAIGSQTSRRQSAGPSLKRRGKPGQSESATSNARNVAESSDSETRALHDLTSSQPSSSPAKSKVVEKRGIHKRNSTRLAEHVVVATRKRQKKVATSDSDSLASGSPCSGETNNQSHLQKGNEDASSSSQKVRSPSGGRSLGKGSPAFSGRPVTYSDDTLKKGEFVDENICKELSDVKSWKAIEKALFEKGLEIFGRNRLVT